MGLRWLQGGNEDIISRFEIVNSSVNRRSIRSSKQRMSITNTNEMEHCATMLSDRQTKSDIVCKNEHCTDDETRISLVVYRTLIDTVRRKRNGVITGLPERPDIDEISLHSQNYVSTIPARETYCRIWRLPENRSRNQWWTPASACSP